MSIVFKQFWLIEYLRLSLSIQLGNNFRRQVLEKKVESHNSRIQKVAAL